MANPGGPLAGIKVLDVAGMIAAPSACAMMADLGADVIKVEPPQGDLLRGLVTVPEGPDPWWELDNRGKRGIAIDLKTQTGRQSEARRALPWDAPVFFCCVTFHARASGYRLNATSEPAGCYFVSRSAATETSGD